jgi:hypothetical protein
MRLEFARKVLQQPHQTPIDHGRDQAHQRSFHRRQELIRIILLHSSDPLPVEAVTIDDVCEEGMPLHKACIRVAEEVNVLPQRFDTRPHVVGRQTFETVQLRNLPFDLPE